MNKNNNSFFKKLILCMLVFALVVSPMFAAESENSGFSTYFNNVAKTFQIVAISIAAIVFIICGLRVLTNGGLNPENTKYIMGCVVGVVIIALALTLPTFIKGLGGNASQITG